MKKHKKPCTKSKKVIDRGKRSKTPSEVSQSKTNINPWSFLEISPVQKEDPPLHKLQDHPYPISVSLLSIRRHSATRKHLFLYPQGDWPGLRNSKKDKHQH